MSGRHSAKATLASTKPSGEPQSKVRPLIVAAEKPAASRSLSMASVSWISLPAPRSWFSSMREYLRLQDVAAVDVEIRRRGSRLRLLDHAGDPEAAIDVVAPADDAVFVGFRRIALLDAR